MRIAYLSDYPPMDVHIWSGTPSFIYKTLCKYHNVTWIGGGVVNAMEWYHEYNHDKVPYYSEYYIKEICKLLSKKINSNDFDVVLTCTYYMVSELKVDIPVIFFSDVVFDKFKTYISNNDDAYHKLARATEQRCLERADVVIFSSEWAKKSAIDSYKISPNKIRVIEFGANIPTPHNVNINSYNEICNLVFIGKVSKLKGLDVAIETFKELRRRNFLCQLTIVGCDVKLSDKEGIRVFPHLDKNKEKDLKQFDQILREANFLILPTRFDAFGIVFCEASAYGVPSIAPNVGGVSQPIKNGKNGVLLAPSSSPSDYANKIIEIYSDKLNYLKMRKTSLVEFNKRLNWDCWCKKFTEIGTEVKSKKKTNKDYYIPTYVTAHSKRDDQRKHIEEEFRNREEFDVTIVDAIKHPVDAVASWKTIKKCINRAITRNEDVIIICKSNHSFTKNYSKDYLITNIFDAGLLGVELLFGGVGNHDIAVPIANNLYWLNNFHSVRFVVLYKPIFMRILKYQFKDTDDIDFVLSSLSEKCCVIYPFISKNEGIHSPDNILPKSVQFDSCTRIPDISMKKLQLIHSVRNRFR